MIIDSLTDKSGINIADLTVSEVKTEAFATFDPEIDVSAEDLKSGIEVYVNYRNNLLLAMGWAGALEKFSRMIEFSRFAVSLKFFSSLEEPRKSLDHELFLVFREQFNDSLLVRKRLNLVANAMCLFPEFTLEYFRSSSYPDTLQEIVILIERAASRKDWIAFSEMILNARQFFSFPAGVPVQIGSILPWEWEGIRAEIEDKRPSADWLAFKKSVILSAELKLLSPERSGELGLNGKVWQRMRESLDELREKKSWEEFFQFAYWMAILAAEKAEITSQGKIELEMPKPKLETKEKIPEMPERKKF